MFTYFPGTTTGNPWGICSTGTARVTSTREAVDFSVDLPDDADMPTWMLGRGQVYQE